MSTPLDLDGKPFCPTGSAQRYHAVGECGCVTTARGKDVSIGESQRTTSNATVVTTEAGRAPCGARLAWDEIAVCGTHGIECFEAEARAALLAELEAGVEALDATPYYASEDEAADMCPNCLTPWRCNGPHVPTERTPAGFDVDRAAVLGLIRKAGE